MQPEQIERLGYGVERFLFSRFPVRQTAVALLPGVTHLLKPQLLSPSATVKGYLRESVEILGTLVWPGKERGFATFRRGRIWLGKSFPKPPIFA